MLLIKMTEPPSYAPFVIDSNGHSYQEFTMRLEKVTVLNSQSVSAENVGSWKASLNSPIVVKDAANMTHFSAVTVYRVVTVLVRRVMSSSVNTVVQVDGLSSHANSETIRFQKKNLLTLQQLGFLNCYTF